MGNNTKSVTTKRLFFQLFVGNYISDLLCCASYPATSSDARFYFLDDFAARLRAMPEVTRLRSVQKAHMPVIKLTFRSARSARSLRVDITYAHVPSTAPLCRMALNGFKSGEAVLAR